MPRMFHQSKTCQYFVLLKRIPLHLFAWKLGSDTAPYSWKGVYNNAANDISTYKAYGYRETQQ